MAARKSSSKRTVAASDLRNDGSDSKSRAWYLGTRAQLIEAGLVRDGDFPGDSQCDRKSSHAFSRDGCKIQISYRSRLSPPTFRVRIIDVAKATVEDERAAAEHDRKYPEDAARHRAREAAEAAITQLIDSRVDFGVIRRDEACFTEWAGTKSALIEAGVCVEQQFPTGRKRTICRSLAEAPDGVWWLTNALRGGYFMYRADRPDGWRHAAPVFTDWRRVDGVPLPAARGEFRIDQRVVFTGSEQSRQWAAAMFPGVGVVVGPRTRHPAVVGRTNEWHSYFVRWGAEVESFAEWWLRAADALPEPSQPDTLGWRAWNWNAKRRRLVSPHRETFWDSPELQVQQWNEADVVRGTSGIHARRMPADWRKAGWPFNGNTEGPHSAEQTGLITGVVERFGRYVLGTDGWRAERVIIRELLAPDVATMFALMAAYPAEVKVHLQEGSDGHR